MTDKSSSPSATSHAYARVRALFEALSRRDPEVSESDWETMSDADRDKMASAIDEVFPVASAPSEMAPSTKAWSEMDGHERAAYNAGAEAACTPSAIERTPRWVPVSAEIAAMRINEVSIGLPIFGVAENGQWYRLDGIVEGPK